MPVFALFFPVEMAVAATAVVHFANNLFKIVVVGSYADRSLVIRFGVPALLAALVGASLLSWVSSFGEIFSYSLFGREAVITPIKAIMAVLIYAFALFELLPRFRRHQFDRKYLSLGGILSGFFGGLSGHQGALRSAFLVKTGISTETFVGTNAVIGFMVDLARISIYTALFFSARKGTIFGSDIHSLILVAICGAWIGVTIGKRFLHKVTMTSVQNLTGSLLLLISLALGSGII